MLKKHPCFAYVYKCAYSYMYYINYKKKSHKKLKRN